MSTKLPCNLLLGIQNVALKVSEEEESCVRKETNSSDPSKIMALVALDLAMCGLKFETETRSLSNNVHAENEQLLALVDEFQL
jgi:hypothetical protein